MQAKTKTLDENENASGGANSLERDSFGKNSQSGLRNRRGAALRGLEFLPAQRPNLLCHRHAEAIWGGMWEAIRCSARKKLHTRVVQ